MAIRTYYRADKRPFKDEDPIRTEGTFIANHPPAGKLAEQLLEESRPDGKPQRGDCLMLFEKEEDARDYCAKMTNGFLYEVAADDNLLLHRGDMVLVNKIARAFLDEQPADSTLADAYWNGDETDTPIIEVLFLEGRVVKKLDFTQAEREMRIKKIYKITTAADSDDEEDYPFLAFKPNG